MPLCSRRAWTTWKGPVDPSRLTTYPHPVATTTASRPATFSIRYSHRKDGGCLSSRPSTHSGRRCSTCTSFIPAKPKLASHFYPGTHTHTEIRGHAVPRREYVRSTWKAQ